MKDSNIKTGIEKSAIAEQERRVLKKGGAGGIAVTYRFSWFISSQDPEPEACVLPPQEDILLLRIRH